MTDRRRRAERRGRWAEWLAAGLLVLKGYRIEARRFKTPLGEVDIIARRGEVIAFIEVKARREEDDALHALTPQAQRRIQAAADLFLARRPSLAQHGVRYDAVTVSGRGVRHLKSVWRPAA